MTFRESISFDSNNLPVSREKIIEAAKVCEIQLILKNLILCYSLPMRTRLLKIFHMVMTLLLVPKEPNCLAVKNVILTDEAVLIFTFSK